MFPGVTVLPVCSPRCIRFAAMHVASWTSSSASSAPTQLTLRMHDLRRGTTSSCNIQPACGDMMIPFGGGLKRKISGTEKRRGLDRDEVSLKYLSHQNGGLLQ